MNEIHTPVKLTVLLPVYNAELYLREAIDSILSQTFEDFELLVFNDASTDGTAGVLASYSDPRLNIITSQTNKGYIEHLNQGLKLAKGQYVARMDADDISLPTRFAQQISFLEQNPAYGLCGTWVTSFGVDTKDLLWELPTTHHEICIHHLFKDSALAHPSVMLRKEVLMRHGICYNTDLLPSEDYDLWVRLSRVTKLCNLPIPLLKYRVHPEQISTLKQNRRLEVLRMVQKKQLEFLGIYPSEMQASLHYELTRENYSTFEQQEGLDGLQNLENWLKLLHDTNSQKAIFDPELFQTKTAQLWYRACAASTHKGLKVPRLFFGSVLSASYPMGPKERLRFYLKAFLKK